MALCLGFIKRFIKTTQQNARKFRKQRCFLNYFIDWACIGIFFSFYLKHMKKLIITSLILVACLNLAAQEFGTVVGHVLDEDNLPLPGANVLVPAVNIGAATNSFGEFRLSSLPVGRHVVEVRFIGFLTVTDTVNIMTDAVTKMTVSMTSGIVELGAVTVVGERLKGQAKALNQQKENFNITNIVSADQIGRFPDQNIGDALKRLPSISVNYNQGEARYANIRGVGPSLNAVTIDGEFAPSADAETRAVQLDLMPAEMIQSIEVNKTVTPDMDADAIGGSINLVTRQAPFVRRLSVTVGGGYNALSGKPRINSSLIVGKRFFDEKVGLIFSGSWDDNRLQSHNSEGIWRFDESGAVVPKQWDVRLYDIRRLRKSVSAAADFRVSENNRYFLNVMYNHRDDWENRVRLRYRIDELDQDGLSEKTIIRRQTKGGPESGRNNNARLEDQRTQKIQLKGKHNIGDLFQAEWSISFGNAAEDRPRERYISWEADDAPVVVDLADPAAPSFYDQVGNKKFKIEELSEEFKKTQERNRKFKIDFDVPFVRKGAYKSTFYFGGKIKGKTKDRDQAFNQIKFTDAAEEQFGKMTDSEIADFSQRNFLAGNYDIGHFTSYNYLGALDFSDTTYFKISDDQKRYVAGNYSAEEDVSSAYVMFDQRLGKDVDVKVGMRAEGTSILYRGFGWDDESKLASPRNGADDYVNWLPGVHLKYRPQKNLTIRGAWTNSLSRPNYFDLVPYRSISRGGEVLRMGNPFLRPTTSSNFDFSIEQYYKSIGILSLALFSKQIDNFIYVHKEHEFADSFTGNQYDEFCQPRNGTTAQLAGVEIAYQHQFGFLPGFLSNFGVYANYTFIHSRANSPALVKSISLPGTAPHTLNLNLTYETTAVIAGLSLNYTSPYLDPDEVDLTPGLERYYDKVTYLDFNASYKIAHNLRIYFEAQNLLNQPLRYYAGVVERTYQQEYYSFRLNAGIKYNFK
jgi:TonB-dependent receptor